MPKAPKSASQYHYHIKKSNLAGTGKAPTSAITKIKYDFEMDRKESEPSRLGYIYVSALPNTPTSALDPLAMATACEQSRSKFANSKASFMGHVDLSLPKELNTNQRHELIRSIVDYHRDELQVPVYAAEHSADDENNNWHIHLSFPMQYVHAANDGGFKLGDRLIQYRTAAVRTAAGLPKSNHEDLLRVRATVGNLIADAMIKANVNIHLAERWRHGYLKLHQQVKEAIRRGDTEFVFDNAMRRPSRKEGYNTSRWNKPSYSDQREKAEKHNQAGQDENIAVETVVRNMLDHILDLAEKANLNEPEHIRMLARDHGITIEWTRASSSRTAKVTGMRVHNFTGKEIGITLYDLKKRMGWKELPAYKRYPDKAGEDFDRYAELVHKANIGVIPGQAKDIVPRAIKATQIIAEKQLTEAAAVRDAAAARARQDAPNATKERGEAARSAQRFPLGEKPNESLPQERPDIQDQRQGIKDPRDATITDQPSHSHMPPDKPAVRPSHPAYDDLLKELTMNQPRINRQNPAISAADLLESMKKFEEEERKRLEKKRKEQGQIPQYERAPIPAGNIHDPISTPEDLFNKQKDKPPMSEIERKKILQEQLDEFNQKQREIVRAMKIEHEQNMGMSSHQRATDYEQSRPRPRG